MTRRERSPMLILVGVLGFGLLTAAYAIWALTVQVQTNQELIKQQQRTVAELLDRDAENTQALSDQQQLVRGLQAQVLKLGGKPLLTPPATAPLTPSPRSSGGAPSGTPSLPSPHPSARPSRSPRPTGSPSHGPTPPAPSPTPSGLCLGPICLGPR